MRAVHVSQVIRWVTVTALVTLGLSSVTSAAVAPEQRMTSARVRALVASENSRPGTTAWRLGPRGAEHEIEGYADRVSVLPGESFRVFVSTTAATFRVDAYRMGWYGGRQGRWTWGSGVLAGRQQPAPVVLPATHTVTTSWAPSATVPTRDWPPGAYLLKLTASTGGHRYIPMVVRSDSTAGRVVLVMAVNTWQAYNGWGGYSLYNGPIGFADRSRAVSFDRPYDRSGAAKFITFERPVVARAEMLGLPLAYVTSADLDADPGILSGARAVISLGHDEYWTRREKDAVTSARDQGANVAFLGANAVYWRVRYADTTLGPDRLLVGYKSAGSDPAYGTDDPDVTARFRDPPAPSPEETLVGLSYNCFPARGAYRVETPDFWGFAGTGVQRGTVFPGLVGVEIDRAWPLPDTPRPLQVVASSPVLCHGLPTVAQSSYYTTRSGAGVFSVGTMNWTCALAAECRPPSDVTAAGVAFVQKVTDTVLRAFAQGPAALQHPALDNLR